ncbi:MAG: hypothetical protein ABDH61_05690, partial [Acidilobaceae archaeon]
MRGRSREIAVKAIALALLLLPLSALASAYYLMHSEVRIRPQPPSARFLPGCALSVDRAAVIWTDFDENQFPPPGWWSTNPQYIFRVQGHKGYGVRGEGHANPSLFAPYLTVNTSQGIFVSMKFRIPPN